jgi:hypothetical protein
MGSAEAGSAFILGIEVEAKVGRRQPRQFFEIIAFGRVAQINGRREASWKIWFTPFVEFM